MGVVYINEAIEDDRARAVTVAHEMGHAFGLFHVAAEERASLMNPGNLSVGLTPADVETLIGLWGSCTQE